MSNRPKTLERKAGRKNGILRVVFVGLSVLLEAGFLAFLFLTRMDRYAEFISIASRLLALILVLGIYSQKRSASIRMPWIILCLTMPLVGVSLYVLVGLSGSTGKMRRRYAEIDDRLFPYLTQDPTVMEDLEAQHPSCAGVSRYLLTQGRYPLYRNAGVRYYADAAEGLEAQKADMRAARKYIFMEYFAIEDAEAWQSVEDILVEKAAEGVEVRVFYDDIGSIAFINTDFVRKLEALGIRCRVFNPTLYFFNLFLNNRDHRKITIIDGVIGYTGGYNIANEYFNMTSPYGHWKDSGIRLEGEVVRGMTIAFLEMWNAVRADDADDESFVRYLPGAGLPQIGQMVGDSVAQSAADAAGTGADLPESGRDESPTGADAPESRGFVQFYADSPMDKKPVGEDVYLNMASRAQRYLYIMTPYLILTDEMSRVLGLTAKRGVDVRIITPGIPDKKVIYRLTRSYYQRLVSEGVRIYEYTPGFCHAKMTLSDDLIATCGTINLDYRSLYHHFEDGCVLVDTDVTGKILADFKDTFAASEEVTEKYLGGGSALLRMESLFLRLFAPLL